MGDSAAARPAGAPAPEAAPAHEPARASDFCPSLGVYLAAAEAGFSPILGDVIIDGLAWNASTPLPTARRCSVSRSFSGPELSATCHFSPGTTDGSAAHEALVAQVRACDRRWTRVDSVDAGVRVAALTLPQGAPIRVETDPVTNGVVEQRLRVAATSAAPASPVAPVAPATSGDSSSLAVDFSAFKWGQSPSSIAPAPAPPAPVLDVAPVTSQAGSEVPRFVAELKERFVATGVFTFVSDERYGLESGYTAFAVHMKPGVALNVTIVARSTTPFTARIRGWGIEDIRFTELRNAGPGLFVMGLTVEPGDRVGEAQVVVLPDGGDFGDVRVVQFERPSH